VGRETKRWTEKWEGKQNGGLRSGKGNKMVEREVGRETKWWTEKWEGKQNGGEREVGRETKWWTEKWEGKQNGREDGVNLVSFRKIAKRDYQTRHVCPRVRKEQHGFHCGRIFMKFHI
jgi:hypothetical protein